jgi:hypothetical protein
MTDATNGALAEDADFTEEEMAYLSGQEPEAGEEAAEGAQEAQEGEEPADGAEQPEAAQGQPAAPAEPERQKTVPHQALHEERERRRAVEARLQEIAEQKARTDERLNILLQWAQNETDAASKANQPAPPDKNEDPIGYLQWENQQLKQQFGQYDQRFQQHEQFLQQQYQTQAQQQFRQQVWDAYTNDITTFSVEQPDFNDALNHLRDVRSKELQAMGFQGNQIAQQIGVDLEQFVTAALRNGTRPAEALYALAKARMYQQGASPQQQQAAASVAAGQAQPNGQQAQPGQKLQTIAKGQASNKSLSGSGSGSPQPMDATAIAGMDDDEFATFMATCSDKKLQKMLGY